MEGEETVKVPAGAFDCYKLKFGLKLTGIAKIAAAFVPDMYIWIERAEPHRWIKFEGKEAGFTKPRTVSARAAL
jgi:hypothetical protein